LNKIYDLECVRCHSEKIVKAGYVSEKQRHKCKCCGYFFTKNSKSKPYSIKRLAIELYLEGMSYRLISKILKVSDVAILKWIKGIGSDLEKYRKRDRKIEQIRIEAFKRDVFQNNDLERKGFLIVDVFDEEMRSYWVKV